MDEHDEGHEEKETGHRPEVIPEIPIPTAGEMHSNETKPTQTKVGTTKSGSNSKFFRKPPSIGIDRYIELLLTCAIAYFAYSQVTVAKSSSEEGSKQIGQIIVAADRINDAADSFSRSSANISRGVTDAVNKLDAQAKATGRSANAAISAASTAKETLFISERAYVSIGSPLLNLPARRIDIPLLNGGKIPSGPVEIVVYEATMNIADPSDLGSVFTAAEKHWNKISMQPIPINPLISFRVDTPELSADKINNGLQRVVFAGSISYGDGFPKTPKQAWDFCAVSNFDMKSKILSFRPCDSVDVVKTLKQAVQYPQNEYREN